MTTRCEICGQKGMGNYTPWNRAEYKWVRYNPHERVILICKWCRWVLDLFPKVKKHSQVVKL